MFNLEGKRNCLHGAFETLKQAYQLVAPTGKLTDDEINQANFYFVIRSIIFKQTIGNTPDTETMNKHVQKMVEETSNVVELKLLKN